MKYPRLLSVVLLLLLTLFANSALAAGDVEITRIDGHYLDRLINMVIEWQSTYPVVKARITVGRETRDIMVDEYDNRRDTRGYHGTLSLQLPADPQASIPYTIQLEDELRQVSILTSGKITPAAMGANPYQNYPQSDDSWGRSSMRGGGTPTYRQPDARTGTMVDRLIEVVDRYDLAPSIDKIKVNILSTDTVSFSTKANDDKGLREVRFKIYDHKGTLVGIESQTGLGKVWQGTSQTFTLGGGTFRASAQAIDTAGNTSKEENSSFELTGKIIALPPLQDVAQPQTSQSQWPQNQPAGAGTTTPSAYPTMQPTYDATGQAIPPATTYQQPTGTYQSPDGTYQQPTVPYPPPPETYQPPPAPVTPQPTPGSTPGWW